MIHGGVAGERTTVTLTAGEEGTIFIRSIFVLMLSIYCSCSILGNIILAIFKQSFLILTRHDVVGSSIASSGRVILI